MLSLHIVLSFLLVCLTFSRDECLCHKAELFWPSKHSTLLQSSIYSRRNKNNPQVPCRAHKKLCRNWLLLWLPVQSPINPGGPSHPKFLLGTKKTIYISYAVPHSLVEEHNPTAVAAKPHQISWLWLKVYSYDPERFPFPPENWITWSQQD